MADKLREQFRKLTSKKYSEQAKWFLNGFWDNGSHAEEIWNFTQGFIKFDEKKAAGNELDEFWSHKFLESIGETLTIVEMREKLKKIDLDVNGKVALVEFLAFHYDKSVKQVVDAPQGANKDELDKASQKLESLQDSLLKVQAALEAQRTAEESLKKLEEENHAAVNDLKKQQTEFDELKAVLEKKANEDPSQIQRNKASNELAQLNNGIKADNLRAAKLKQEAALKKVTKARTQAEAARISLEQQVIETEKALVEAEEVLENLKNQPANPEGSIWWMERELQEAHKYLPKKKK